MARQLIGDMTAPWKPDAYEDKFTAAIHALAAQRVKAGDTEKVDADRDRCGADGQQRGRPDRAAAAQPGYAQAAGEGEEGCGRQGGAARQRQGHAGNGTKAKSAPRKSAPRKSALARRPPARPRRRRRGSAPPEPPLGRPARSH